MSQTRLWTREEIENFLDREILHYQKIELPFGLTTPGADRRKTYEKFFTENVSGKTVLDVGCSLGYFALRRSHAGRVARWDGS